jgi:regulator of extracellular matrix RemA (YlzA/DUF370 family)
MSKHQTIPLPYLWPVGTAGLVAPERVLAVGRWNSAPIRRAAHLARTEGRLVDLTFGKACKWVIFLDSGHIVLATEPMPVASIDEDTFNLYIDRYDKESGL